MQSFTEAELREAAGTGGAEVLRDILTVMHKGVRLARYTEDEFLQACGKTGWHTIGPEILAIAKKNADKNLEIREAGFTAAPSAPSRDDTLTYGELEDCLRDIEGVYGTIVSSKVDKIAKWVHDHREVLLDRRVYKSAEGVYYRWSEISDAFWQFGSGSLVNRDYPKRPLELLP